MFKKSMNIADYDPVLWQAIQDENRRQEEHIELIASENYASPRVMEAQGSQFTNKYAEGYPGKRYYGGCEYADIVEQLAIDRAKELFGADYVNVQPHSGSQANAAVYGALINACLLYTSLILITLFGNKILPKSGMWMETVKKLFGFVMLALPVFLISRILPDEWTPRLWAMLGTAFFIWFAFQMPKNGTGWVFLSLIHIWMNIRVVKLNRKLNT